MTQALGLIETVGLTAAIEAADTAVKSANVTLIGYELTKGGGMVTVKIEGDVGAVKAAISSARAAAEKVGEVFSTQVIPRPAKGLEALVITAETVGLETAPAAPVAAEEKKRRGRPTAAAAAAAAATAATVTDAPQARAAAKAAGTKKKKKATRTRAAAKAKAPAVAEAPATVETPAAVEEPEAVEATAAVEEPVVVEEPAEAEQQG